jgi:acyl-CoA thioester hydrolase
MDLNSMTSRTPADKTAHEIFRYPLLIREAHLDTFGHVNNATYFQLLEEARWEFITARGFGMKTIRESGLGPTILGFEVRFLKELRLRQTVTIESQMLSYVKKIGVLRQDIVDDAGAKYFTASMTLGLFDTAARKLVPPTPEWLAAVGFSGADV